MKRKTLKSLDQVQILSVVCSLVAALALGLLVHRMMWSHVEAREAERAPVKKPAPVRVVSGAMLA